MTTHTQLDQQISSESIAPSRSPPPTAHYPIQDQHFAPRATRAIWVRNLLAPRDSVPPNLRNNHHSNSTMPTSGTERAKNSQTDASFSNGLAFIPNTDFFTDPQPCYQLLRASHRCACPLRIGCSGHRLQWVDGWVSYSYKHLWPRFVSQPASASVYDEPKAKGGSYHRQENKRDPSQPAHLHFPQPNPTTNQAWHKHSTSYTCALLGTLPGLLQNRHRMQLFPH